MTNIFNNLTIRFTNELIKSIFLINSYFVFFVHKIHSLLGKNIPV